MEFGATIMGYLCAGILKPIVMIFAGGLLVRMIRSYRQEATADAWLRITADQKPVYRILLVSLVFFALSELFCAFETYVLLCSDAKWQIMHSLTSGISMGLFAVGLFMLLDERLVHFGEGTCCMKPVCGGCPKITKGHCTVEPFVVLGCLLLVLMAIPPLFASTAQMTANPSLYVLPADGLNNWYDHTVMPWMMSVCPRYRPLGEVVFVTALPQAFDYQLLPVVSMALTLAGWLLFRSGKRVTQMRGLYLVVFASGLLGYTYYQLVLQRAMGDLLIAAIGHEVGELFFLFILVKMLTVFFAQRGTPQDAA